MRRHREESTRPFDAWDLCALCPRLCRPSCPVASGSTREAAVPALIAATLLAWERGQVDDERARQAATLCTDCGACQRHCHIDRPLPELLRSVRAEIVPCPGMAALEPLEGVGRLVAIEADSRPFAEALARRLGEPVRRWRTSDRLGVEAVEHPEFAAHAVKIRDQAASAEIVVVDGGVAQALDAAGVSFKWLVEVVPDLPIGTASCRAAGSERPAACCGAGGPLPRHHPEDARRVGAFFLRRGAMDRVADARCREHLRGCGGEVQDPLDALMGGST